MTQLTSLGRFPRINFVVSTDYNGTMNDVNSPNEVGFTLHLFVPMSAEQATALEKAMAARKRADAHSILKDAMDKVLTEEDKAGARARAIIAAAFK